MSERDEIRAVIKSFVKTDKSPKEAYEFLVEAYGDHCPSKTMVYRYHKEFCEGRESIESGQGKSAKPSLRNPENINFGSICYSNQ